MLSVVLVILGSIALLCYVGMTSSKKKNREIPGPVGNIFLGDLPEFWKNLERLDDWLVDLTKIHGDTFVVKLPGKPDFVFTTNTKNVEHILKTNFPNYEKGEFFRNTLHDVLGNGIFNSDGEVWKPQRKITSNLFNVKHFRDGMMHVFVEHSAKVLDLIEKSPKNVDVSDLFYRFTLDSIGCIAFGKDIDSLGNPEVEFARAWDESNSLIVERFWSLHPVLRKLTFDEMKIRKDLKVMNAFADEILQTRKKENPETLAERFDLLSLFISRRNQFEEHYSDEYLRDMIMNMIIAGRDTTAQSLAWTCYLLAQHPEVCAKLREEVDQVLGDSKPTYDNLKQMEYLYSVISESLRLYPSVPRDPHTCGQNDVLPTGHKVEAGSFVFYFAYGMGRSSELWGDDCMEFKPERFFNDPKQAKDTFKFTAFQGGPRTCLGQNMAYLEEQTLLAMIFQKFDFELVPNQDVKIQVSLTCPMEKGLRLNFTPRAH